MGGGSETVRSAQVIGLSKEYGKLKKKILLENGKFISSGMNVVVKARGKSIVEIKSIYNKKYLEANNLRKKTEKAIFKLIKEL